MARRRLRDHGDRAREGGSSEEDGLAEGLGNTNGVDMARKQSTGCWLMRVLCCMFYHEGPFQAQLGVMAFLEATSGMLSEDGACSKMGELEG